MQIIQPTPSNIEKFTSIICSAFHSTPLTTIFIAEVDAHTNPDSTTSLAQPPFSHARRIAHFRSGIESAAQCGADLVEAGNWSALALWEPPNFQGKPFVEASDRKGEIFAEWRAAARRMKATYLGDPDDASGTTVRPFYHLSFLARNPGNPTPTGEENDYAVANVPGAISAVVLPYLQRAEQEGVPVWLEATYPHAVAIYEHLGFRVCEEVVVGRGRCDENGWPCEGGKAVGVSAWGMIYDPQLR